MIIAKNSTDTFVNASQAVVINGHDYTKAIKRNGMGDRNKNTALVVLNGKLSEMNA